MRHPTAAIVIVAIAVLLSVAAPVAIAGSGKLAIIFVDRSVSKWDSITLYPRIMYERKWYLAHGYDVIHKDATPDAMVDALLQHEVGALSYFGHGHGPTDPEATSTMKGLPARVWVRLLETEIRKRHIAAGVSSEDAKARAQKEVENLKLDLLRVHACSSLYDVDLALALVRPGGSYYGVGGFYTPCPTVWTLRSDVSFMLDEYRVPTAAPEPAASASAPDMMAVEALCARLGPASRCLGPSEPGCQPCPDMGKGFIAWYHPDQL